MVVCCEIVGRGTCIQLSLVSVLLLVFVSPFSSSREFSGFPPHLLPYQSLHSILVKLGTRTQKKFTHFSLLLWGYDWNALVTVYSVPKFVPNDILQNYQKSIHLWKVKKLCFLTWSPKVQLAITSVWSLLLRWRGLHHLSKYKYKHWNSLGHEW